MDAVRFNDRDAIDTIVRMTKEAGVVVQPRAVAAFREKVTKAADAREEMGVRDWDLSSSPPVDKVQVITTLLRDLGLHDLVPRVTSYADDPLEDPRNKLDALALQAREIVPTGISPTPVRESVVDTLNQTVASGGFATGPDGRPMSKGVPSASRMAQLAADAEAVVKTAAARGARAAVAKAAPRPTHIRVISKRA